jgi:hypothetical protein
MTLGVIRAVIVPVPQRDMVDIYLLGRDTFARLSATNSWEEPGDRGVEWCGHDPGIEPERFLRLDAEIWAAIVAAMHPLETDAAAVLREAWADTRAVRDRLLGVVERDHEPLHVWTGDE